MRIFFKISFTIISIFILLLLSFSSIYAINTIKNIPEIDLLSLTPQSNTVIYDKDNNKISDYGVTLNKYVTINEINKNMINAIVSVEDNDFYNHNGINFERMLKATLNNIKSGSFKEGASTLEQQLIKNIYLTTDKTIDRKITEVALALKMDKMLTKDQIIEAYLNNVLFGGNVYGIEMASNYYFNKSAKDLTIADSALLAGIVQLPNYYNPFNNPEASNERRNLIINLMYKNNYITEDEAIKNRNIPISSQLNNGYAVNNNSYASSFIDYTNSYLAENSINISTKNYEIKTTMNSEIQKELFDIINNKYNMFPDNKLKCAIVVLDNSDGGILGIVGNKNSNKKVLNYATTLIQPGSTIKPILDYAPAIEYLNYSPGTIILDEPYNYSTGQSLKNWDNIFKGHITLRQALSESRNIPAVKLFNEVGKEKSLDFASRLNIIPNGEVFESEAIGGSTYGYSLLSLTNAYLAFANMGQFAKATPIKSVSSNDYEYNHITDFKTVMKPSTAYLVNSMLHDVFKNSKFNLSYTYLCAKTGQTNYSSDVINKYNIPSNATKDSLLIAYTKDMTIGIWISYDELSSSTYLDTAKVNIARTVMKHLFDKFALPNMYYEMPNNIIACQVAKEYNQLYLADSTNYTNSYQEYFIIGSEPKTKKNKNEYFES